MALLQLQIYDGWARLTLQRPQARNALNAALVAELTATCQALPTQLRVLLLQGAGAVFCAGADVHEMRASGHSAPAANLAAAQALAQLFACVQQLPQVVVGQLHGAALGGGLGLAACCDIVLASSETLFALPEVRLGLAPAVIAPYVLAKIGHSQARRWCLSGARFSAAQAQQMGLVHVVCAADTLDTAVQEQLDALLQNGPQALRATKAMLAHLAAPSPTALQTYTSTLLAQRRSSPEAQAGLAAAAAHQPPPWAPPS